MRLALMLSVSIAVAGTPVFAQEGQFSWRLSPLSMVPTGDGFFDAIQTVELHNPEFPATAAFTVKLTHVRADGVEDKLRPLFEERIRAYAKQIDDSVSRIEPYRPNP